MLLKIRVSVTVVIFSISTNSPTYKITMEKIVILEIVLVGTVIVGDSLLRNGRTSSLKDSVYGVSYGNTGF